MTSHPYDVLISAEFAQIVVSSYNTHCSMVEKVLLTYGRIDILVNNAGGASGINFGIGRVLRISERDWDETIAINLKSVFLCTRAIAKIMLDQKKAVS